MKESLFEILLNIFETTLLRLKEANDLQGERLLSSEKKINIVSEKERTPLDVFHLMVVKEASPDAIRVFSPSEQMKLSKASYQFLMRLSSWGVISRDFMEVILTRLLLSESHMVSLQETKWTIRSLLADKLPQDQLAYLDLVLYHKEDAIVRH